MSAPRSPRRSPCSGEVARRQLQAAVEYVYQFHDPTVAAIAMFAFSTEAVMLARDARVRDHPAIYRRRLELHPGKSARQATSHETGPRRVTRKTASNRTYAQIAARNRALDAVAKMRRNGMSLTRAAREARSTPDAVRRYAGNALEQQGSRWVAKPNDRLLRRQLTTIIGIHGEPVEALVETRSSRQSSEIGQHNSDRSAFVSASTSPAAKREARARLVLRHGKRAGLRAELPDGTVIDNPRFYGEPEGLQHLAVETDLSDLDYGSDAPTRFSR